MLRGLAMLYERNTENMKTKINYEAIREQKQAMLQRFLQAKQQAEKNGQVVAKPI